MDSSSGRRTLSATVSAFAPGYDKLTETLGGAISGKRVMGSNWLPINPNKTINMDITAEKIGREMILFNI